MPSIYSERNSAERYSAGLVFGITEILSYNDQMRGPNWATVRLRENATATVKWSNPKPPPKIGDRVEIDFNGFGPGTVMAYFTEAGYLGVEVECDVRPKWHIEQNGDKHKRPLVFGAELKY